MSKTVKIHFFGAAGTVTGSKFLLETEEMNILIDCGMFQGLKELRELNWEEPSFPPDEIDLVLLTHGHLDHSGYLPRLVSKGFTGTIRGTAPTLAIAEIIMFDSAKIQEEDADRANEEEYTKHDPALPLYTIEDVEKTTGLFHSAEPESWYEASENIRYRFLKNGHILGATFIELDIFGKIFVFSGDIGRQEDLLLEPPSHPEWADYLILESTYGDRLHPAEDAAEILAGTIKETLQKKGTLIIPSFAVERLQTLMFLIWKLYDQNKIPHLPVFIDSPMGNAVWTVFERFSSWHKLSKTDLRSMENFFEMITSYKDTWKTVDDNRSKVVIAGSGMVTGGRVLTYLRYYLDKPDTTVLLVGFQAEGTRGRQLQEGAHDIKIFGKYCTVNAKILNIGSLSAHADQQGLLDWVSGIRNIPEAVYLIHGENTARDVLRVKLKDQTGWNVHLPNLQEVVKITIGEKEKDL
ncbi:metallo-beta-lactamase family protein [Salinimicrobium catena]|uniref:Metallo-beta-lactamase family protein n=1 Tax=Salinimicrobium catena TaxID=390640 RepID=A0A1H5MYZ5_9FLAO|nr:MBL fold metallo-hydrolase [Salinimicrobium catena]SDL33011.1 metallo-beta-lactamase family protein [Salinimicrobium catena]SEE94599.1 metallo-beta-lactamase family protein [Salinimicrobium catena]